MKKILLLAMMVLCLAVTTGCSTRGTIATADKNAALSAGATFQNFEVIDESGYVWGDDEEKVDLAHDLKTALDSALAKEHMAGTDYVIKTIITEYSPGNAFQRWLMPGFGATKLNTKSEIYTPDGTKIATVPVERYIGFGGAFTIGAWKTVTHDVAEEIVNVLKKATGRTKTEPISE